MAELAELQDAGSSRSPGSVLNPVCGSPYIVDTCCAAAVFAAEFQRTGDEWWRRRALEAVAAAGVAPFDGVDEPSWSTSEWHRVAGSLPATAIAVDAYCSATVRLGSARDVPAASLASFLARCRAPSGGFGHNPPAQGQPGTDVMNATAAALCLAVQPQLCGAADVAGALGDLSVPLRRLAHGQAASGFWPYYAKGRRLRLQEMLSSRPLRSILGPDRFASYWAHGDLMHHTMTLYYVSGYALLGSSPEARRMLAKGWTWLSQRLESDPVGGVSISWSGERALEAPRSSNARDTNAYFLILGALPSLVSCGVVEANEARRLTSGLLLHVAQNLLREPGASPCISPVEGAPEVVRNVLPMFEQSTAWKGRLLAEAVVPAGALF